MDYTNLTREFKKAGLRLEILSDPIRTREGMEFIVQIDINRAISGNKRTEYFRLFPGKNQDATIQIRDIDKEHKQLVLLIKEAERTFEERQDHPTWAHDGNEDFDTWVAFVLKNNPRIKILKKVKGTGKRSPGYILIERKTDARTRYFLMGVDERQLFIAQTQTPVTTVAEARKSLGKTVQLAEGTRRGSSADRQGEWFFLETSHEVRNHIDQMIEKNRTTIERDQPVGLKMGRQGGNPHVADEMVVLTLKNASTTNHLSHGFPVRDRQVFVRGKIRHTDHKTVKFSQWREVIANDEGATATAAAGGVFWVD